MGYACVAFVWPSLAKGNGTGMRFETEKKTKWLCIECLVRSLLEVGCRG